MFLATEIVDKVNIFIKVIFQINKKMSCVIHCTNDDSKLVQSKDYDSWKSLVNAAIIRQHRGILEIADNLVSGTWPDNIFYHRNCRAKFTMKRLLDEISSSSVDEEVVRRSSRESSSTKSAVFKKSCIFCHKKKYIKKSNTLEQLRCCSQLRVNSSIEEAAKVKNDTNILSIIVDDLVAKEAWYHHSCYRAYTRVNFRNQKKELNNEVTADYEFDNVQLELSKLADKPKVLDFKIIQNLVKDKKNLKRKICNKFELFKFISLKKKTLIYPDTISKNELVLEYFHLKLELEEALELKKEEKMIIQSAKLLRREIKDMKFCVSWPPTAEELDVEKFSLTPFVNHFFDHLLSDNPFNGLSVKNSRLKLSFAQDIIYAGIVNNVIRKLNFLFLNIIFYTEEVVSA